MIESILIISVLVTIFFPKLIKIFCVLGWHSWAIKKGNHRECMHCKKRQSWIRVGGDGWWK